MAATDRANPPTPPNVRVAHAILDATDLARHAAQRFGLPSALRATLIAHGQNDWYALEQGEHRYALRVLKSGWRTRAQLEAELRWQQSLASDLPVASPLQSIDGQPLFEVAAPEGPRFVCLYPWIDGQTLDRNLDCEQAKQAGRQLAALHRHPSRLESGARAHDLPRKLSATAAALDAALRTADERAIVEQARSHVAASLGRIVELPHCSLHGDLHFGNLRRDRDDRLWLLDFDDCGDGACVADLTAFVWRNRCEELPVELDAAFMAGYESIRPLNRNEREALPTLHVARALYLAGVFARDRDRLGRVPGFDRPWPHYIALLRDALRAAT